MLIAVNKQLPSKLINIPRNEIEQVFVAVHPTSQISSSVQFTYHAKLNTFYEEHYRIVESIYEANAEETFILCGNYNQPDITWANNDLTS